MVGAGAALSVVGLIPHEAPARGKRASVLRLVDQFAGLLAASAALSAGRALSFYLNTAPKAKKTTKKTGDAPVHERPNKYSEPYVVPCETI